MTITVGTGLHLIPAEGYEIEFTNEVRVAAMGSSHAVATMWGWISPDFAESVLVTWLCRLDGTAFTEVAQAYWSVGADSSWANHDIEMMTDTTALVVGAARAPDDDHAYMAVLTRSGDGISYGSTVTLHNGYSSQIYVVRLDDTHAVIAALQDESPTFQTNLYLVEISGTSCSVLDTATFSGGPVGLALIDPNRVMVMWNVGGGSDPGNTLNVAVYDSDGSSLTLVDSLTGIQDDLYWASGSETPYFPYYDAAGTDGSSTLTGVGAGKAVLGFGYIDFSAFNLHSQSQLWTYSGGSITHGSIHDVIAETAPGEAGWQNHGPVRGELIGGQVYFASAKSEGGIVPHITAGGTTGVAGETAIIPVTGSFGGADSCDLDGLSGPVVAFVTRAYDCSGDHPVIWYVSLGASAIWSINQITMVSGAAPEAPSGNPLVARVHFAVSDLALDYPDYLTAVTDSGFAARVTVNRNGSDWWVSLTLVPGVTFVDASSFGIYTMVDVTDLSSWTSYLSHDAFVQESPAHARYHFTQASIPFGTTNGTETFAFAPGGIDGPGPWSP